MAYGKPEPSGKLNHPRQLYASGQGGQLLTSVKAQTDWKVGSFC